MSPADEFQPPPEGTLIRLARQARGLSPEEAAELTPIRLRGGRWRQIEKGYERKEPLKLVRAPDLTLAHMAHTVGVSPDRLSEAGRSEAAEILSEILRAGAGETTATAPIASQEEELLRRVIAATAKELGLSADEAAEAFRRARKDIEESRPASEEPKGPQSSKRRDAG